MANGRPGNETASGLSARLRRGVLRIPLFAKVVIANAVLIVLVAAAGVAIALEPGIAGGARAAALVTPIVTLGVIASVAVNGAILWLALVPLKRIEHTARRVQEGELDARVEPSVLADANLERIAVTFNALLDRAVEYRQRQRDLAARASGAREEERRRLARELHDGTAQRLAGLRVRLRVARKVVDPGARDQQLEQVSREIGDAIDAVRQMAEGLRPPTLDVLGLAAAVVSYARSVAGATNFELDVQAQPVDGALSHEAELALYRILQEAMSNVVRHASASRVVVRLTRTLPEVSLCIVDDGCGFDVDKQYATGSGLLRMQDRATCAGGRMRLDSKPQRGTRIVVTMPNEEAKQRV